MGDPAGTVRALSKLAIAALDGRDPEAAMRFAGEAMRLANDADDPRARLNALNILGTVELAGESYGGAREAFGDALDVAQQLDGIRRDTVATLHYNIALTALLAGDLPGSEHALDETLSLYRSLAHLEGIAYCFVVRAALFVANGEMPEAMELLTAGHRLLDEVGAGLEPVERSLADRTRAALDTHLTERDRDAASRRGIASAETEIAGVS
jgi:tetratricopeptide (TPR) repeat protein